MDYENEALERAKKELAACGSMDCDAARLIFRLFPQLRESEDERIRKYLINELKAAKSVGELKFTIPQPTREECISYLEKQKEPENTSASTIIPSCWECEQKEQKPVECSDCAKHLEGYISGRVDAEKKLLDEYGILIMPEGELRMKPHWKPSDEMLDSLRDTIVQTKGFSYSMYLPELYEQLKNL